MTKDISAWFDCTMDRAAVVMTDNFKFMYKRCYRVVKTWQSLGPVSSYQPVDSSSIPSIVKIDHGNFTCCTTATMGLEV